MATVLRTTRSEGGERVVTLSLRTDSDGDVIVCAQVGDGPTHDLVYFTVNVNDEVELHNYAEGVGDMLYDVFATDCKGRMTCHK